MSILADMLSVTRSTAKSGNLDGNYAYRMAIRAYQRDDSESLTFWLRHGTMTIDGMFTKGLTMNPCSPEELKAYKRKECHAA